MKPFKAYHKAIAIIIGLFFIFQSMCQINSHSYTTGVDSYHYTCGCFGCWESHLAVTCDSNLTTCSFF